MNYEILTIPPFDKQLKRLSKKYHSVKEEFSKFLEDLEKNPKQGISLGYDCYKIHFSIASKGKGKSGGARIITNVIVKSEIVYLLAVYDKSEKDNLMNKELLDLISQIPI